MSADRPRRRGRDSRASADPHNSLRTSTHRQSEAFDVDGAYADRVTGSNAGSGGGGGGSSSSGRGSGDSRWSEAGAARGSRSGWTSDDGGAGGHGTGSRGSRRRLRALTASSPGSPVASVAVAGGTAEEDDDGPHQVAAAEVAAVAAAAAADSKAPTDGGSGGGGRAVSRWTSIDKWSRALGTSRRRGSRQQVRVKVARAWCAVRGVRCAVCGARCMLIASAYSTYLPCR